MTTSAQPGTRTPFVTLTSRYVVLDAHDVDTDQIIPARFLTTTQREGLGRFAFYDLRYEGDGIPRRGFPLDAPDAAGAQVLVVGRNFGCGSSREHAVWALMDAGFRAVVGVSFADIFRTNALGNGLLPVAVPETVIRGLISEREINPGAEVTVDLQERSLRTPAGESVQFDVAPFARHCILHGHDELDFLLAAESERLAYEAVTRVPLDTRAAVRASEVAE